MHVALNAAWLDPGRSGGPETYLRGLVPALAARYPAATFSVITTRRGARALAADGWRDFARIWRLPADEGVRRERFAAELALVVGAARRLGADVLHSTASLGPPCSPGLRHVVTLHDVTFLRMPTFSRATTLAMRLLMAGAARDADALLTGSAAARDEIAAVFGIAPARFAVVHHGAGRPPSVAPLPAGEVRARHALPASARVVLCVGAKRPHKNQGVLVEALPRLPDDVVLVLAGYAEPYEEQLRARALALGLSERVRLPGWLADDELEGLWALARAGGCTALPTLGEGFGLPLLEALQRGVPLACSDLPVLREIGAGLPAYFDPRDPASVAAAIRSVLGDAARGARGPAHAAAFTWERAAEGTYAAYERAVAR